MCDRGDGAATHIVPKVVGAIGFLSGAKVLGDFLLLVTIVVLSRTFGQVGVGQYSFAIGITGFFAVFADFGFFTFTIKELSRLKDPVRQLSTIVTLRVILSVVVLVLLTLIVPFLPIGRESKIIIILIGLYQLLSRIGLGLGAAFIAVDEMRIAASLEILLYTTLTVASTTLLLTGQPLIVAVAAFPAASAVQIVIAYRAVVRRFGGLHITTDWKSLTATYREVMPYGMSLLSYQVSGRTDLVALGLILNEASAGIYNIAYRIVQIPLYLAHFAAVALLPTGVRLYATHPSQASRLYEGVLRWVVILGVLAGAWTYVLAPGIVTSVFGTSFQAAVFPLQLLGGALLFMSVNQMLAHLLIAVDRQRLQVRCQWIGSAVNIAANVTLIGLLGVVGAALARIASEAVISVMYGIALRDLVDWWRVGSRVVMSGASCVGFVVIVVAAGSVPAWAAVGGGTAIYVAVLLMFGSIRRNEAMALRVVARSVARRAVSANP